MFDGACRSVCVGQCVALSWINIDVAVGDVRAVGREGELQAVVRWGDGAICRFLPSFKVVGFVPDDVCRET